jgi:hypothetical protein
MKQESKIVLTLLVILSLLSFTRTLVYLIFSNNLLKLKGKPKEDVTDVTHKVLLVFSIVRLVIVTIILDKRHLQNDILTYVLLFLFLSSIEGFAYTYYGKYYPKSDIFNFLENIQGLNAFIIIASSLYIMKYVFF